MNQTVSRVLWILAGVLLIIAGVICLIEVRARPGPTLSLVSGHLHAALRRHRHR